MAWVGETLHCPRIDIAFIVEDRKPVAEVNKGAYFIVNQFDINLDKHDACFTMYVVRGCRQQISTSLTSMLSTILMLWLLTRSCLVIFEQGFIQAY